MGSDGSRLAHVRAYYEALNTGDAERRRSAATLRLNRIGAGTDEIMREVIGRSYGL